MEGLSPDWGPKGVFYLQMRVGFICEAAGHPRQVIWVLQKRPLSNHKGIPSSLKNVILKHNLVTQKLAKKQNV